MVDYAPWRLTESSQSDNEDKMAVLQEQLKDHKDW